MRHQALFIFLSLNNSVSVKTEQILIRNKNYSLITRGTYIMHLVFKIIQECRKKDE